MPAYSSGRNGFVVTLYLRARAEEIASDPPLSHVSETAATALIKHCLEKMGRVLGSTRRSGANRTANRCFESTIRHSREHAGVVLDTTIVRCSTGPESTASYRMQLGASRLHLMRTRRENAFRSPRLSESPAGRGIRAQRLIAQALAGCSWVWVSVSCETRARAESLRTSAHDEEYYSHLIRIVF